MDLIVDFSLIPTAEHAAEIARLCEAMEAADAEGRYPQLTVERPWSVHNPVLEGEFASPEAIRWYLERELGRLAADGARISVSPRARRRLTCTTRNSARPWTRPAGTCDARSCSCSRPERMALSIDRLQHYTGTARRVLPAVRAADELLLARRGVPGRPARLHRPGLGRPPDARLASRAARPGRA